MLKKQSAGPITKRWCSFKVCSTFFYTTALIPILCHTPISPLISGHESKRVTNSGRGPFETLHFSPWIKDVKLTVWLFFFSFFGQLRLRVWSWLAWWICCLLDMMIQPCYYHEWFQLKARLALSLYGHRDRRELPMKKHKLMWKGTGMASNQKHF